MILQRSMVLCLWEVISIRCIAIHGTHWLFMMSAFQQVLLRLNLLVTAIPGMETPTPVQELTPVFLPMQVAVIRYLQLTIGNAVTTEYIQACESYTWTDGVTYTNSGTYTRNLTGSGGCDSTAHLELEILTPTSGLAVVSSCESYTWIDGLTYTSNNNSATYTLQNSVGCDSVVTLNLTILQPTSSTMTVTSCESYTWYGTTYTSSGNYDHVLTNAVGCDSVITLGLTILPLSGSAQMISACESFTWIDGVTYTSSTNTPTFVTVGSNGCDSIITLNLTIFSPPVIEVTDNGDGTITASGGLTYQWLNCTTNSILTGETNATYAPAANGVYAVIGADPDNCADTSECIVIDHIALPESSLSGLSIYPNPTADQLEIRFDNAQLHLSVLDIHGKHIRQQIVQTGQVISIGELPAGVYLFVFTDESGAQVKRVVKSAD